MSIKRPRHPIGQENSPTNIQGGGGVDLTREGEIATDSSDNKYKVRLGGATRAVVTEDQTQPLTNKTIDADSNTVSNIQTSTLKSGVLNTSTSLASASNTQIPSALAVKSYVDNAVTLHDQAIEISYDHTASGLAATNVQAAIDELHTTDVSLQSSITTNATNISNHIGNSTGAHAASAISVTPFTGVTSTNVQSALAEIEAQVASGSASAVVGPASATDNAIARFDTTTGKLIQNSAVTIGDTGIMAGATIDTASNTITNLANGNISNTANVSRSKLAAGTNNAVVFNDASGVMSNASDLLVGTNALVLQNTKHLEVQAATDSTTTGASATLTAFTAGTVRLTNASLVSIAIIPAGANGQKLTLINRTGNAVTLLTSGNILLGASSTLIIDNNAAVSFDNDSTSSKWQLNGGSGSGTGTASLDTILQLTATEQLTDWSTGNNAAFLGGGSLSGTFAKETTTPLHGTASYKYTQAAGSLNDYLSSATFAVDSRFRGTQTFLSFPFTYNGNTSDIQIIVYDATNSTILSTSSDVVQGTNGANQVAIVSAFIPTTCASVRVGFQVKVLNSTKVFAFDDIQLSNSIYSTSILSNDTDWQSYTPTFTGFGTSTAIEFEWRRSGSEVQIRGKFATGTVTGVEARISLPNNLNSAGISIIPSITRTGDLRRNAAVGANGFDVLIEPSTAYMTFGYFTNSHAVLTKSLGTDFGNTETQTLTASIPIQGWFVGSQAIVTPTQQVSSDSIPFTFKSTAIVVSDPIGTFNTYIKVVNSTAGSTTLQSSAPTQIASSMNSNGILLTATNYATASTTALPSRFDILIGKGLKNVTLAGFSSIGKTSGNEIVIDSQTFSTTDQYGILSTYNETSGILTLEVGNNPSTTVTNRIFQTKVGPSAGSTGYITINAATIPSIAALPILQPRIATLSDVKTNGTAGGSASAATTTTRTLNTTVDTTGIVTSLVSNQFILSAGTYYIEASAQGYLVDQHKIRIRNITDTTTSIIGLSAVSGGAAATATHATLNGEVIISASKTFELQHYTQTASATSGLGRATSSGESEIFSMVKITKVK